MADGFHVDTSALTGVADDLDSAGSRLFGHRDDLQARPDAGRSSQEVADALAGLGAGLAGLAQHIGSMATSLHETAASYTRTDTTVHGHLDRLGPR